MIIFLTNNHLELTEELEYLIIKTPVKLIDEYHLEYNNQILEFDYLIVENPSFITEENLSFIKDDDTIITNWVGQTSIEHIYIGNFDKAIDDLLNN